MSQNASKTRHSTSAFVDEDSAAGKLMRTVDLWSTAIPWSLRFESGNFEPIPWAGGLGVVSSLSSFKAFRARNGHE